MSTQGRVFGVGLLVMVVAFAAWLLIPGSDPPEPATPTESATAKPDEAGGDPQGRTPVQPNAGHAADKHPPAASAAQSNAARRDAGLAPDGGMASDATAINPKPIKAVPVPKDPSTLGPNPVAEADEGDQETNEYDLVTGPWPVSKDGIKAAIAAHMPVLQECYEAWSPTEPGLEGGLVISFTIAPPSEDAKAGPDGSPKRAEIQNIQMTQGTLGHPMVAGCVQNIAASLNFDAPDGVVKVTYPFTFNESEPEPQDDRP